MQWDKKCEAWIKKRCDNKGILTSRGKEAVEFYMAQCLARIRNLEATNFVHIGTCFLDPLKTGKVIRKFYAKYRAGELTREELKAEVTQYLPFHSAAKMHQPRKGLIYKLEQRHKQQREHDKINSNRGQDTDQAPEPTN